MHDKIVDELMFDTRTIINENEDFEGMNIQIIFLNKENARNSVALISNDDLAVEVFLNNKEFIYLHDWSYSVDTDIFENLEKYDIGYFSDEWHYNVWCEIEDYGMEEIEHKLGLQKYLKYCKENGITKEYLDNKLNLDVPDAMKYYEEKNYIEIQNDKVTMPKEMYQKENEVHYITFCLGYDLLNEMLSKSETSECDISYDFCDYIARKFIETDNYKNERFSTYDVLKEWIQDNADIIKSEYLCSNGIDDKVILEIGKRQSTPVALIQKGKGENIEYIVAIGYEVNDKKTEWGYGFYYGNDLLKAREDFERANNGEDLVDTFAEENKKKKKHKERER